MLNAIHRELASLYRLEESLDVASYVVPRSEVKDAALDRPEQVWVRQHEDAVELALVMDDALLKASPHWTLDDYCACVEGVSHLLYLSLVAERNRQVSQLELEVQAEIDKFALLLFTTTTAANDLIRRLFQSFQLRESVTSDEEKLRYDTANRLANGYCTFLTQRYVAPAQTGGLLQELRHVYRMGGTRKLAYVSECRP